MQDIFQKILSDFTGGGGPLFYIAQVVGVIGLICSVVAFQMKTRRGIMRFQAISSIAFAAQLFFLGGLTGAYLDTIAIVRTLVFANRGKRWAESPLWLWFFMGLMLLVGILTYENIFSLLALFSSLLSTVALWLKNSKHIRFLSFFVGPCWIVYNIAHGGYTGALNEIIVMTSIVIGILRHDLGKKTSSGVL